jgi:hypothetical protein
MTHRTHSKAAIEGQRRANWNQSAEDALGYRITI